jgi:hypothetical protein
LSVYKPCLFGIIEISERLGKTDNNRDLSAYNMGICLLFVVWDVCYNKKKYF